MNRIKAAFLWRWQAWQRRRKQAALARAARGARPRRLILGAGGSEYEGWLSTDKDVLDATQPADWLKLFQPGSLDNILSEHVLEHLGWEECRKALSLCHQFLKPGGRLRVAVPDGNRRDEPYHAETKPPYDGHKLLINLDRLTGLLREAGFEPRALEWFDEEGSFHAVAWDESEGPIMRCQRNDRQERYRRGDLLYTSLIMDGIKPRGN